MTQPSSLSHNSPLANQLVPLLLDQLGRLIHLESTLKMADPVQDRIPLGQEILEHPSFIFTIKNALGCLDPGFVPRVQEFELFGLEHLAGGTQQLGEPGTEIDVGTFLVFPVVDVGGGVGPRSGGTGDVSKKVKVFLVQVAELLAPLGRSVDCLARVDQADSSSYLSKG